MACTPLAFAGSSSSVVLVALWMVVFAGGLRRPGVAVAVLDDAVVGWLAGRNAPRVAGTWEALAFLAPGGSWTPWDGGWCLRCSRCGGSGS